MAVVYYAFNSRLESSEILIRLLLVSKFATLLLEAHQLLIPSAKCWYVQEISRYFLLVINYAN